MNAAFWSENLKGRDHSEDLRKMCDILIVYDVITEC
jgi:hypothetical protein